MEQKIITKTNSVQRRLNHWSKWLDSQNKQVTEFNELFEYFLIQVLQQAADRIHQSNYWNYINGHKGLIENQRLQKAIGNTQTFLFQRMSYYQDLCNTRSSKVTCLPSEFLLELKNFEPFNNNLSRFDVNSVIKLPRTSFGDLLVALYKLQEHLLVLASELKYLGGQMRHAINKTNIVHLDFQKQFPSYRNQGDLRSLLQEFLSRPITVQKHKYDQLEIKNLYTYFKTASLVLINNDEDVTGQQMLDQLEYQNNIQIKQDLISFCFALGFALLPVNLDHKDVFGGTSLVLFGILMSWQIADSTIKIATDRTNFVKAVILEIYRNKETDSLIASERLYKRLKRIY